jgi:hypothetical protein
VDIVGGYCGVHIFPLAELELFSITSGRTAGLPCQRSIATRDADNFA